MADPDVDAAPPDDTGIRPMPPFHAADERTLLTGMLDWYRAGVRNKVQGVSAAHASAAPLRSATSINGLVKHLALVEDWWFTVRFAGQAPPPPWADIDFDADPDWEFRTARDEPLADLVALYEAACDRSRAVTDAHLLDDVGVDTERYTFTLRFALLHLVEETARHLGHLDILREQLDGMTGE